MKFGLEMIIGLIFNTFLGVGMFLLFGFMSSRLEIAVLAGVGFWVVGLAGLLKAKETQTVKYSKAPDQK